MKFNIYIKTTFVLYTKVLPIKTTKFFVFYFKKKIIQDILKKLINIQNWKMSISSKQALQELQEMFTDFDPETLKAVLVANSKFNF